MNNTPPRTRRMVIYCRISDDREGRLNGTDRQRRQCEALAEHNGDIIVEVFTDDDRSAYSRKPRPHYRRMLDYLRAGHADGVYALAPTRLYRRLADGLEFFQLIKDHGLEVETVKAGRYNLATADGRRDALRAAVDAQHESEQISERVRDAKQDNVREGSYRGGPRPYGYEADGVTIRESEAAHLRDATHAVIAGEPLRSICRRLTDAGVTTVPRRYKQDDGSKSEPVGKPWEPTELRKALLRPRNAGLMEVSEKAKGVDGKVRKVSRIAGRAAWAPIVPEETWRACKAVLEDPSRSTTPGRTPRWLGSGKFRCGTEGCTETLRATTSGRAKGQERRPAYRCRSGAHVTRLAEQLDEHVTNLILSRLGMPDAAEMLLPPLRDTGEQRRLAAEANTVRARLAAIPAEFADNDQADFAEVRRAIEELKERLGGIEARMSAHRGQSALTALPLGDPDRLDAEWPGYPIDKKRAVMDALMTVFVMPAPRGRPEGWVGGTSYFKPDNIRIEWKVPGGA